MTEAGLAAHLLFFVRAGVVFYLPLANLRD
jgi:hypothetical protein